MSNVLFNLAQAYLNQGMPSIDPIFQAASSTQQSQPLIPQVASGLTPEQLLLLQQQQIAQTTGRDNDDFPRGGGDFGDLDLSDSKTVIRNVYTEVGPNKYEFVPTEIKAFRNIKSGLYQTEDGKNVDAMFTDAPTGGVLGLVSNIFDPRQEPFMEYPLGKIQGTYTNLASLLKNQKNPTNLMTTARQRLIDEGSQITEDFKGGGEFPTNITPKTTGGSIIISPNINEEKGRPDDPRANMGMRDTSASTAARDRAMGIAGKLSGPPRSVRFR
tara:strand:- start:66 stop:878 length:813 start_codon:yes stop_codon:yes gene_type:complete